LIFYILVGASYSPTDNLKSSVVAGTKYSARLPRRSRSQGNNSHLRNSQKHGGCPTARFPEPGSWVWLFFPFKQISTVHTCSSNFLDSKLILLYSLVQVNVYFVPTLRQIPAAFLFSGAKIKRKANPLESTLTEVYQNKAL